jgi:two-component system, OmpR family, response regulator
MRVLLIEPSRLLARPLQRGLGEEGFAVTVADEVGEGDFQSLTADYDVIILDPGRPRVDDPSPLERWRRRGLRTPVLMLTACSSSAGKAAGPEVGADDYLTKPFALDDLFSRLRSLTRRGH